MAQRDPRRWRYSFASVTGASHKKRGERCQDASACEVVEHAGSSLLVAAAADGAGTAHHSRTGSRLACYVLGESLRHLMKRGGGIEDIDRAFAEGVVERFRLVADCVGKLAGHGKRDFACTLLACFVGRDRSAFLQLGDGAIVISRREAPDDYDFVFWPQQGEFANETVFATGSEAEDDLQFHVHKGPVDEVALFSDGLQNMVLDYENRCAHKKFFMPMFRSVRTATSGYSRRLSTALAEYLSSPEIVERTDDDKTLVLATRRAPAPPIPRRSRVRTEETEGIEAEHREFDAS